VSQYPTLRNSVVVLPSRVECPKKNREQIFRRFKIKSRLSRKVGHTSPSNMKPHPGRTEPQFQPYVIHVEFYMNQVKLFRNERASSIILNLTRWQFWPKIKISSFQCSFDSKVKKLTMRSKTRSRLLERYYQVLTVSGISQSPHSKFQYCGSATVADQYV